MSVKHCCECALEILNVFSPILSGRIETLSRVIANMQIHAIEPGVETVGCCLELDRPFLLHHASRILDSWQDIHNSGQLRN